MKHKILTIFFLAALNLFCYAQADTISTNVFQKDGKLGVGTADPGTFLTVVNDTSLIDFATYTSIAEFRREISGQNLQMTLYAYPNLDVIKPHVRNSMMIYATGDARDLILCATNSDGRLRFFTQSWGYAESERMRIEPNGHVGIGTTTPLSTLDVNGDINLSGILLRNGEPIDLSGLWSTTELNRVFYEGKVGIGTTYPNTWLTVVNEDPQIGLHTNTSLADFRRVYGESIARFTIYGYPDTELIPEYMRGSVMLYTSGDAKNLKLSATPRGGCIQFLTDGWASDTSERMRIDARGKVGIGTKTPAYRLDVDGDINFTGTLLNNGSPIDLEAESSPWIRQAEDTIHYSGNVGIGTGSPAARLQVAGGDIYISDIDRGIIMHSPDGQCWRGVLDNTGTLQFTAIDCPGIVTTDKAARAEASSQIRVYPNPSDGHVLVDLGNHEPGRTFYAIYNTGGSIIEQGHIESTIQSLDLSDFKAGNYILTINNRRGKRLVSRQLVLQD